MQVNKLNEESAISTAAITKSHYPIPISEIVKNSELMFD